MDNHSYTDTLGRLNQDKARLLVELDLINVAINALTKLNAGVNVTSVKDRAVVNKPNSSNGNKPRKNYYEDVDVKIPQQYGTELTSVEEVIYALSRIGSGTIEDIAGCIVEIDAAKDYEKIFPKYREIASGLYRAGKINADTTRKKYKYSLKGVGVEPKIDDGLLTELEDEFIYDRTK